MSARPDPTLAAIVASDPTLRAMFAAPAARRRIAENAAATAAAALVALMATIKHESAGTDFVQDETHALALAVARTIGHDTTIVALAGTDADPIAALKRAIRML